MRFRAVSILGMILAITHFAFVLLVSGQHYEGSWGYALFALPDLPVMLALLLIDNMFVPMSPVAFWLFLGIFGSMWWYLIGVWLRWVFRSKYTGSDQKEEG